MSFREIKRRARQDLHQIMKVPALYLVPAPEGSPSPYEDPVSVDVRLHYKFKALGDMVGTNFNYAERNEAVTQVVFLRADLANPQRGAVFSIQTGEAYQIDNLEPFDDITVTANVTRLPPSKAAGLAVPE